MAVVWRACGDDLSICKKLMSDIRGEANRWQMR